MKKQTSSAGFLDAMSGNTLLLFFYNKMPVTFWQLADSNFY